MSRVERILLEGGRILFRRYHDNGAIESEAILRHERGAIEGMSRRWHPNGVLAEEFSVHDGVYDGVHRIWDANGKLLDEFEMKKGTGVSHIWSLGRDSEWEFLGEISMIGGQMTGRQRCYLDAERKEGFELYWINDNKVSKKRYLEACASGPRQPVLFRNNLDRAAIIVSSGRRRRRSFRVAVETLSAASAGRMNWSVLRRRGGSPRRSGDFSEE